MAQTMRARSPVQQISALESGLRSPDPVTRTRAADRIFNIGNAHPPDSRIRQISITALLRSYEQEREQPVRDNLRQKLETLGCTEQELGYDIARAVPSRAESAAARAVRLAGTAAIRAGLAPLVVLFSMAGCANITTYEDSVMYGETELVREISEEITAGCETDLERVIAIVRWGQTNLPHFHGDYGTDTYPQGREVEDISITQIFRERVVGCHLAVFTLATMLRSVGVDATYVRSEDIEGGEESHGILYIPSLDRYVHGDAVCLGNTWPTEDLVLMRGEVGQRLESRNSHSGAWLRRDGDFLYLEDGILLYGYEEAELERLRQMFPDFNIRTNGRDSNGNMRIISDRVPIRTLD